MSCLARARSTHLSHQPRFRPENRNIVRDPSVDQVLANVRKAAARTGRVFAIGYDLTGAPKDKIVELLTADWKRLVDDTQLTQDGRYLHHDKKPVLFVFGFYADRFGPQIANRLI